MATLIQSMKNPRLFSLTCILLFALSACAAPATAVPTIAPMRISATSAPIPLEFNVTHAFSNPQRTSSYDYSAIRELPAVLWTKSLGSSASISAPVFVDGVLYIGAQNGQLYALNTETGAEIWHTASGSLPSAVAVAGELVFNNDGIGRTQAFRRDTGEKIWSVETSGAVYGTPLVIGNIVYAVSERGVYALDRLTGKKVWEKNTGSHRGFVPSPAFSDGTLYFGVGPTFYALDAQTGQELWKIQSETWFYGAALASHFVYVGNDDGYFYAFNSKTGEEIWKSPLADAGWSSPAIANGRVYVGNRDQHLYAFDAQTGSELWKTELEDWATSDPLVTDDVIYVGSGNHENQDGPRHLYALDARTGAELWKFKADSRLLTAPALSANTIYILSISGIVYALKAPTPAPTLQPLTGIWMGAVNKPDGSSASIQITLDESSASLNIEPFTKGWDIDLVQANNEIRFSLTGESRDPFTQINFTGSFVDNVLSGDVNLDGQETFVTFRPIASIDSSLLTAYEGMYRFESGRVLSVIVSPEYSAGGLEFFSKTLMLTDFDSGALRSLYPLEELTFAVGALRVVGAPFEGQIQFIKDSQGNVEGLMWWDSLTDTIPSDTSGQYAERVSFVQEKVSFTSADGTKLSGLLSFPDSSSIYPAFMMLHGSEPGAKDNFGNKVMAHYMLSQGFAILNYDKRGVGESEGRYQEAASQANLQRHADDAIAGVQYLLTRPEIDVKKIGLIGFSQAGWIIPLAASQSSEISFFVNLSGPVASFAQEDKFSAYTDDSYTAREYDDDIITQQLRDMNPGGFDPLPIIAELNQNGLWLWGSVDKSVPTTFSAENLQAMIDSGKDNFSYQIFPNGDHNLNFSPNGYFSEIPYSSGVLFYSFLSQWLETYILSS